MIMADYKFTYVSVLRSEARMFDDLAVVLDRHRIQGHLRQRILLALSEAFVNALVHANALNPAKEVVLSININETMFSADIVDQGHGGTERVRCKQKPALLAENGRGIDLIRHCCDAVEFIRHGSGGMRVSMRFNRDKSDDRTRDERHERSQIHSSYSEEVMNINLREDGSVTILDLDGRLDLASGSALKEQVKELLEKGKSSIHLNLAQVDFINSSGLGALVSMMKESRLHKGRLTLSNLASYVQEIFDITQLSHIFEIFPTEQEAINSFQVVNTN